MTALFRDEPALVGNVVAALLGLALVLGVDTDVAGAVAALLTVVAGIWIRASVYPQRSVDFLVNAGAQRTATDMAAADTGQGGQLTTTGEAVARQAASDVLAGVKPPGPRDDDEHGAAGLLTLAIIGFAVLLLIGGFAFCDLLIDDESEENDRHLLGRVELVSP